MRQHACAGIGGTAGRSHMRGEGGSRRVRSREGEALGPFAPTSAANGLYGGDRSHVSGGDSAHLG